jgi:hypothetical protein
MTITSPDLWSTTGCPTFAQNVDSRTLCTTRPTNEPYNVDAIDVADIDPKYLRQVVDFPTNEPAGTIAGLEFTGSSTVEYKKKWPRWTPTSAMVQREPVRYKPWQKGMDGGARNPLGARACICSRTARTRCFAFTVRPNHGASVRPCRRAAFAWSTRTSSICTAGYLTAQRWSFDSRLFNANARRLPNWRSCHLKPY